MQKQKEDVRARITEAKIRRGIIVYLYGNGKGKSSSAFGMLARSLGHDKKAVVFQFIKGKWNTNEQLLFKNMDNVEFYTMATGFTWDTQDLDKDTTAAKEVWKKALPILKDPNIDLVLFDELTYMFAYGYLPIEEAVEALQSRPEKQNVIITGRDAIPELLDIADTVSEVKEIKHAFKQGVKAQKGIEF